MAAHELAQENQRSGEEKRNGTIAMRVGLLGRFLTGERAKLSIPLPLPPSLVCILLGGETKMYRPFTNRSDGGDGDVRLDGTNVGRSDKGSTSPRFYKNVSVKADISSEGTSWFVQLDGRTLKTPSKAKLALPTEALAHAIAAEWEYQEAKSIRPFTMPLMQLTATAIDRTPFVRSDTIDTLIKYFHTDPALCMIEEDTDLGRFQAEAWQPLMEWFEEVSLIINAIQITL